MAGRLHPTTAAGSPSPPPSAATSQTNSGQNRKPPPANPVPPPPTYVVRIPREQILRCPPPENAEKYEKLVHRNSRPSCFWRCCCFTFCLLLILIVAAAVSAGVMYLVFGFKSPKYMVTKVSVRGMNLTSVAPISPGFDVSIRAENPNGKVGIYYLKDSAVSIFYNGVGLGDGVLADLYQPKKNVTVLQVTLTGSDVVLDGAAKTALRNAQRRGKVPLFVNVEAPIIFEVGSVKTWEVVADVKCDVVLDMLNVKAKIVSKSCDYSMRLW